MDNPVLGELLLDAPTVMGVESIEVDTVTLRMVARTLPGKQFEAGRQLRVLVDPGTRPRRHRHHGRRDGERRRGRPRRPGRRRAAEAARETAHGCGAQR